MCGAARAKQRGVALLIVAALIGIGNSVIHPADYAILSGSVPKDRMGRAFALHTFSGNLGFAAGPPVIALLMTVMGWRPFRFSWAGA